MKRAIALRVLSIIITLIFTSLLVFFFLDRAEGDSVSYLFSEDSIIEDVSSNAPFFSRYSSFLKTFFSIDWGNDISGKDIKSLIKARAPLSIELALYSSLLSLLISLPLSISASRDGSSISRYALSFLSSFSLALPSFLIAIILSLIGGYWLKLFPIAGFIPISNSLFGNIRSLFLPALTLSLSHIAIFLRLFLTTFKENLKGEYVLSAKGWGLSDKDILPHEVMKPSIPVLSSLIAQSLATGIAGSAVVESVFSLPGLGSMMLSAALKRDVALLGFMLLSLSIVVSLVFIISEIISLLSDPREVKNA